jgi:hypothetical protein
VSEDNPDLPTLRVRGLALLGGVSVEVRLPGRDHQAGQKTPSIGAEGRSDETHVRAGPH